MKNDCDAIAKDRKISSLEKSKTKSKRLALKIFINTVYGVLGQNGSPLFCIVLPMIVTALGRKIFQLAIDTVYKYFKDSKVPAGDTDSCFVAIST